MKRYSLALFAVLALAFIGLSPSKAQAASCSTTTGTGFPKNFLYNCSLITADFTTATQALQKFPSQSGGAQTTLTGGGGNMFTFAALTDYTAYCGQAGNTPYLMCDPKGWPAGMGKGGSTYNNGSHYYSVIIKDQFQRLGGTSGPTLSQILSATVAHEAGHQLDYLYRTLWGVSSIFVSEDYIPVPITPQPGPFATLVTGTKLGVGDYANTYQGDQIFLTVNGNGIVNNQVSYTVASTGETTAAVASGLVAVINMTGGTLNNHGVSASNVVGGVATNVITVNSLGAVEYTISYTFKNPPNGTFLWYYNGPLTYAYDYQIDNKKPTPCGPGDVFYQTVDSLGQYICNGTDGTGSALTNVSPNFYQNVYDNNKLNSDVLQKAWPYFFTETESPGRWAELFAELTVVASGNAESSTNFTPDNFIAPRQWFTCSLAFVKSLETNGKIPTLLTPCQ